MTNVPPGAEDGYCGPIAYELHRIANDLGQIASYELPEPRHFELNIQPGGKTDQEVIEAIDAIGLALLGIAGKQGQTGGDSWYEVVGYRGPVKINAYRALSKPDPRDAEIAELRARVAELEARDGLGLSRESDGVAPGRVEPHTGAVTDGGLVDETEPCDDAGHAEFLAEGLVCTRCGAKPDPAADETECPSEWHVSARNQRRRCPICNGAE